MKTCTKCKTEKPKAEFSKQKLAKDGIRSYCKACASLAAAKRYIVAREKILEVGMAWHAANKQRHSERGRLWYLKNTEKHAANVKANTARKPGYEAAKARNYRAKKIAANGSHTHIDIAAAFVRQRGMCASCACKLVKSGKGIYHVDHIMPLAKGGTNWPDNLQCLCPTCNLRKSDKLPDVWAKENGRLL